jgi:hypothetical protein
MDQHLDNSIQQMQDHTNETVTSMVQMHLAPMNKSIKCLEADRISSAKELSAFLNERQDLIKLVFNLVSITAVLIILVVIAWLLLQISRALVRYLAQEAPRPIIREDAAQARAAAAAAAAAGEDIQMEDLQQHNAADMLSLSGQ